MRKVMCDGSYGGNQLKRQCAVLIKIIEGKNLSVSRIEG